MHDFLNRRCQHTPFGLRTVKNRIVIFFFSKQKTQINQSINRQTLTKITDRLLPICKVKAEVDLPKPFPANFPPHDASYTNSSLAIISPFRPLQIRQHNLVSSISLKEGSPANANHQPEFFSRPGGRIHKSSIIVLYQWSLSFHCKRTRRDEFARGEERDVSRERRMGCPTSQSHSTA